MSYVEAPRYLEGIYEKNLGRKSCPTLFLAGSISGAWNWQKEMANKLRQYYHIFNPRRGNYNSFSPEMEREQITWEYIHLEYCDNILFYFSHETLAPITLLELGAYLDYGRKNQKNIYICINPEYKRKNDVLIQTELRAPNLLKNITYNLCDLTKLLISEADKNYQLVTK